MSFYKDFGASEYGMFHLHLVRKSPNGQRPGVFVEIKLLF
jgi:hypothetical protein